MTANETQKKVFEIRSPFAFRVRLTWLRVYRPIWFSIWRVGPRRWSIEWPLGHALYRWLFKRCAICGSRFKVSDRDLVGLSLRTDAAKIAHYGCWVVTDLDGSKLSAHYGCYNLKSGPLKVRGREF